MHLGLDRWLLEPNYETCIGSMALEYTQLAFQGIVGTQVPNDETYTEPPYLRSDEPSFTDIAFASQQQVQWACCHAAVSICRLCLCIAGWDRLPAWLLIDCRLAHTKHNRLSNI